MAKVDYRTVDRKKMDRYLRPEIEEASLSDVLVPAASLFLFFTKPGQALMGGAMKGLFGLAKGAGKGIRGVGNFAGRKAVKAGLSLGDKIAGGAAGRGLDAARGGFRAATSSAEQGANLLTNAAEAGAKRAFKFGKGTINAAANVGRFIQRRPGVAGAAIIGAGLLGGAKAGLDKKPFLLKMDMGRGNPAIGRMYKQPGQGLSPGHLGATGDLTLNMHRGR